MRLLVVQLVRPQRPPVLPEYDQDLAVAAALLERQGVEAALWATDGHDLSGLHPTVNRLRPSAAAIDVPPARLSAARQIIQELSGRQFLPVIAVGQYATCQPEQAISIPGVGAVIVGEYERPLAQLLGAMPEEPAPSEPADDRPIDWKVRPPPGLWFNGEDGLVRGSPAELAEDLDALPFGKRELFDYGRIVGATGEAVFHATRGCRRWCAFCLNDWRLEMYGQERYLRRRSVGNLLEEVQAVTGRYPGARTVAFADHAFAADADWLAAFAEEYPRRSELPFRCHVRPAEATVRAAGLLARAGCRDVHVEIGSGSNFIRQEVLAIPEDRATIIRGVAALRGQGLDVTAGVFVGAPYDGEVAVEETLALLAELKVRRVRARVFHPMPGTQAAEICRENGWISGRGEENFALGRSVLDMPSLPAERIDYIVRHYDALLKRRRGKGVGAWVEKLRRLGTTPFRRKK